MARTAVAPALLRSSLFVGMIALAVASLVFTSRLVRSLEERSATFTHLFARFAAGATMAASRDEEVHRIFRGFMDHVTFPIIVTDQRGVPWTAKGTGVSVDAIGYEVFASTDPANPPPGAISTLLRQAYEMDLERTPIPMTHPDTGEIFGYVHYGESSLAKQLRLMPVIQIAIASVLVGLAYFGIRSVRQGERRSIWVGMAKETAHQLGTPISSMMGWVDLLDEEARDQETRATLAEMRTDLARLTRVAQRFERIGTAPRLEALNVNDVVAEVAAYLRRRLPTRGRRVEIVEQLGEVPRIRADRELVAWTVENLLKNSVDAILRGEHGSRILVSTAAANPSGVRILFEDDGPGIPEAIQNRTFEPGFTTKKTGWGLGLALAKRITEDYHGGRLRLLRSTPGVRTVFAITLPAGEEPSGGAENERR